MATYYWRNSGNVNWGTATNWSTTDGGAGDGSVPTSSDDAMFTSNGGPCTVNTSSRVCKTLNFTGYTNTITMTFSITVSGSVTLVSAMTISGAGALTVNATATLTSNGKTWPNALTISFAGTATLADNWTVGGTYTVNTSGVTVNGNTLFMNAGFTVSSTASGALGTTAYVMQGTGSWSGVGALLGSNSLTINTAGTITIADGVRMISGVFTYTAGTVITSGAVEFRNGTVNASGMTFTEVTITTTASLTLSSTLNATTLTVSASANVSFVGSAGFTVGTLIFTGTGTRTHTLTYGNTYLVNTSFSNTGSTTSLRVTLTSSDATNQVVFTLSGGATCALGYLNGTRIDSSGGRPVRTFQGTLTTTTNWQSFSDMTERVTASVS